ncbi:MAG: CHAT domain-containing protein [Gloeotrichia echinulata IR180]
MARKWSLLFRSVESFLRLTSRILTILWRGWGYSRLVVVMLLGIFILTAGMPVVLSQMTGASQIAQSFGKKQKSGFQDIKNQIQEVKKLQNEGLYYTACKTLIATVLPFYAGLTCDDLEQKYWQEIKNKIDAQNNDTQVIIWFYFGEIMRVIGDLEKSEEALNKGLKVAKNLSSEQQAVIYLSLANTFRAKGNLERDRRSSPVYDYMPWQYVKREEIEEATEDYNKAQENYKSAINYSSSSIFRFIAQVNLLSLLIEKNQLREAQELSSQIYSQKTNISEIPENLKLKFIYAQINLAKSLAYLKQISEKPDKPADNPTINWDKIISLLRELQKEAKKIKINSKTAESYVLGNLGGMYEYLGKLNKAQKATEEALYLAQPSEASNIAYQWQWQMGRLLKQQGKIKEAIASYEAAVKTLESVRGDLLAINSDVQFSFRDNVEPLYRELVDLLLIPDGETEPSQNNLQKSIYYVDNLQVAELENNLRCNLRSLGFITLRRQSNQNDLDSVKGFNESLEEYLIKQTEKTALIYPIILKEHSAIIIKTPNKKLIFQPIFEKQENIKHYIQKALESLNVKVYDIGLQKPLQELYELLIKPVAKFINEQNFKNLIFVPDSLLRLIPIIALHDGNEYLIEKDYYISVSPSIQLLKKQSNKDFKKLNALIVGAVKEPSHSTEKPNSSSEKDIEQFEEQIKIASGHFIRNKILFSQSPWNNPFTKDSFRRELQSSQYDMLHLVAHGQFSSDPKKTVIYTDDDSNNEEDYTINLNELREFFKSGSLKTSLELLILSACETAEGDNRAVLGIAGIAVKVNAIGTIAPLWSAEQKATTKLIEKFYENIVTNNSSKVKALHDAQKDFLQEAKKAKEAYCFSTPFNCQAPYYWASLILLGS